MSSPASAFLWILTRRLPLAEAADVGIGIDGDADLARHWIDNTAHVSD